MMSITSSKFLLIKCIAFFLILFTLVNAKRQYYPGYGYVDERQVARLTAYKSPTSVYKMSSARLRAIPEYEFIERESIPVNTRRKYIHSKNPRKRTKSLYRRTRKGYNNARRFYNYPKLARQESEVSTVTSSTISPVSSFSKFFPNINAGGAIGAGFAQSNGPGAAFGAGFAQSNGKNSFAGGFGAAFSPPGFHLDTKDKNIETNNVREHKQDDNLGFDDTQTVTNNNFPVKEDPDVVEEPPNDDFDESQVNCNHGKSQLSKKLLKLRKLRKLRKL